VWAAVNVEAVEVVARVVGRDHDERVHVGQHFSAQDALGGNKEWLKKEELRSAHKTMINCACVSWSHKCVWFWYNRP